MVVWVDGFCQEQSCYACSPHGFQLFCNHLEGSSSCDDVINDDDFLSCDVTGVEAEAFDWISGFSCEVTSFMVVLIVDGIDCYLVAGSLDCFSKLFVASLCLALGGCRDEADVPTCLLSICYFLDLVQESTLNFVVEVAVFEVIASLTVCQLLGICLVSHWEIVFEVLISIHFSYIF